MVVVEKSAITYEHTVLVYMKDLGKGVSIRITSPEVAIYIRKLFGRLLLTIYNFVIALPQKMSLGLGRSSFLSKVYNGDFSTKKVVMKVRKAKNCFLAAYIFSNLQNAMKKAEPPCP